MIDVREANAGPAMDAACAEAKGKKVVWYEEPVDGDHQALQYQKMEDGIVPEAGLRIPYYSTRIGAAWSLSQALRATGAIVVVEIGPHEGDYQECRVYREEQEGYWTDVIEAEAETEELAICRAFLLASGIAEIEEER